MRTATISRYPSEDDGTFGRYKSDSGFECESGELPDRANHADLSCVTMGRYLCKKLWSELHKRKVYHLTEKMGEDGKWGPLDGGRTNIEFHSANLFGDIHKGYASQLRGCITLGRSIGLFRKGDNFIAANGCSPEIRPIVLTKDQRGLTSSKDAIAGFEADMDGQDFVLTIQ